MVDAQPCEEYLPALVLMVAAPLCEEEAPALVLMAAGHHNADARSPVDAGVPVHSDTDDPALCDYTVVFLRHPASRVCTSHACSSNDLHPTCANDYADRGSVYGNIRPAHSKHILAVLQ
jgi:hypothetical protein